MDELSDIQLRLLGSLLEKKETTPEQYPLTLNALRAACNQKTARHPVTAYSEREVGHAVRELEALDLVREVWGGRVPRYEHRVGAALGLHSAGLALLCVLMLRGPQTLGELKSHSQRLHEFDGLDDVQYALSRLESHEPPLVKPLPRQPGQKEIRYAQLLGGEPPKDYDPAPGPRAGSGALENRVGALEDALQELQQRLEALENAD
ncbi:MAG: YceH family protein [Xanthomonadales bacterium]|nr:YceH family protein [Xanthomonadales bacterium]